MPATFVNVRILNQTLLFNPRLTYHSTVYRVQNKTRLILILKNKQQNEKIDAKQ